MDRAPSTGKLIMTGAIDDRMIATMRLTLAVSALSIIYLDPAEPDRLVPITYGALICYALYSALLFVLSLRQTPLARAAHAWSHWADVGWYLVLISLSSGTSSIFFFFFFFSILVSSFRWGFASGLRVTIVSSILFSIIGYLTVPSASYFELNRSLLRPIYLLVFGYMMAYWGGSEVTLKRRLTLLREVTLLSNPRFGLTRTLSVIMERLCSFYHADACVVILEDPDTGEYKLRRTDGRGSESSLLAEPITGEAAQQLLALPRECAAIYGRRFRWWVGPPGYYAFDVTTGGRLDAGRETCQTMAALLDTESLATIPIHYQNKMMGRVFLTSRRHAFSRSEAEFLIHIYEQVMPVIENIRLVDRLAADAAENERQKIARDIHDSVIQPYVGLQIGLVAIDQKLTRGSDEVHKDVTRLIELTHLSISELRQYVRGLKGIAEHEGSLLPSVRRFATKYAGATGIAVQVDAKGEVTVSDRLAAEAFQMVTEGLSNIRRHTRATEAFIGLTCADRVFELRIENNAADESSPPPFTPRTIAERAQALGGRAHVEQQYGITSVIVRVPL